MEDNITPFQASDKGQIENHDRLSTKQLEEAILTQRVALKSNETPIGNVF